VTTAIEVSMTSVLETVRHIDLVGNKSISGFRTVRPLEDAHSGSASWVSSKREGWRDRALNSGADVIFADRAVTEDEFGQSPKLFIICEDPKIEFIRMVQRFFAVKRPSGIHHTAVIHPDAKLGKDVYIGAFATIGRCVIGDSTVILEHCSVHDDVVIGERCWLHPGCRVGTEGFGYVRGESGLEKFPHVGGVLIGNDVEIGANCCIDRGTLGATIIRTGAKLDNLVHIAHNADIGEETLVIAHTMIAGSVKVGKRVWIAPGSRITNGISVGDDALIGLGSVVLKSIPAEQNWFGCPARPTMWK